MIPVHIAALVATLDICSLFCWLFRVKGHHCLLRVDWAFGIKLMSSEGDYDVLIGWSSWIVWFRPKVRWDCSHECHFCVSRSCEWNQFLEMSSGNVNASSILWNWVQLVQLTTWRGPACTRCNIGLVGLLKISCKTLSHRLHWFLFCQVTEHDILSNNLEGASISNLYKFIKV